MKKRILLLLLSISIFSSNINVKAEGLDNVETIIDNEKSISENTLDENKFYGYLSEESYFDVKKDSDESLERAGTSNFPTSYDARNYGYITSKKGQYNGTCWAFASIAAAEASIVKSGLANNTIDLSEYHLAYYTYQKCTDPLGNTNNDFTHVGDSVYDILNYGGNLDDVSEQFAKWCGPVLESSMPGTDAINLVKPSKDISFQSLYHLKKAIYGDPSNKDEIKDLICKYGSVATSYYVGAAAYVNYEDYAEATYHFPTKVAANHCVSIIGWNDNYPKENFNYKPSGNGAWLVKEHDGANQKYMWISYYTYLEDAVAFEFESASRLQNNYQYDGCTDVSDFLYDIFGSSKVEAKSCMNIFKAKKSQKTLEKIETVMIHQPRNNTFDIQIYVNPVIKDGQIINYDYKSKSFSHSSTYAGIYQVDVPEDIYVNDGDTFAIEVSGVDIKYYAVSSSTPWGVESMNAGECYVGKVENGKFSYKDIFTYNNPGTPRIKAFTNSTSIPLVTNMNIDVTQKTLKLGEGFTIHANNVVPAGGKDGICYSSSNPEVATVDANGTVKAISTGTTTITATSTYGTAKKTCTVNVKGNIATSLKVEPKVTVLTAGRYTLQTTLDPNATERKLSYSSSDESVALVDSNGEVYGVLPGTATITVKTVDGSNLVATCVVKVQVAYDEDTSTEVKPITELLVVQASSYNLNVGDVANLIVKRYPETVADERMEYSISNPEIISLNNGVIKALNPGTATIVVTALDSGVSGSVSIKVTAPEKKEETVKIGTKFKSNSLNYTIISADTVKITGASSNNIKTLTVPATVKYKNKTYKVTEIEKKAFYAYKKLKTVKIGKNVTKIGSSAFAKCPIEKITVPSSVKEIGSSAFKECKSLKSITIGSSTEKIGKNAFNGCKKLKTITIKSKKLTTVGKNAFKGIDAKAKITVPKSKYSTYKKTTFKKAGLGSKVTWKKK